MAQAQNDIAWLEVAKEAQEKLQTRSKDEIKAEIDDVLLTDVIVKVVVIGASMVGKSHFIKNILCYPNGDPQAPSHGQKRKKRTLYEAHHNLVCYKRSNGNVEYYDAMGLGYGPMENVTPEKYWKSQRFDDYDAYILLTRGSITGAEKRLIELLVEAQKPFAVVVTYFDCALRADWDEYQKPDEGVENYEAKIKECRKKVAESLRRELEEPILEELPDCCKDRTKLYFVNNFAPGDPETDFEELKNDLPQLLKNEKKRAALLRTLFTLSSRSVEEKVAWWRNRSATIALTGLSGASPIPFVVDFPVFAGTIVKVIRELHSDFYLTDEKLNELLDLYSIDRGRKSEIQKKFKYAISSGKLASGLINAETLSSVLSRLVGYGAIIIGVNGVDDVFKAFPVLGTIIGCTLGAATGYLSTYFVIEKAISNLREDALILQREILAIVSEESGKSNAKKSLDSH